MATVWAKGGLWVAAQFVLLISGSMLPSVFGGWLPWPVPMPPVLGWGVLALGVLLALAGLLRLGPGLTPLPAPVAGAPLQTRGAYGLVRHPIYSGIIFACLGWALLAASMAVVAFPLVMLAFFDRKAAREEKWLGDKHPGYQDYRRKVRKLIPFLY